MGSEEHNAPCLKRVGRVSQLCQLPVVPGQVVRSLRRAARELEAVRVREAEFPRQVEPKLLVAAQPTRGLDVGAIEGVHHLLLDLRKSGAAVLLVSEELEEITSLSDRIAVIYEGRIMGTMPGRDANLEKIGLMMTGTPVPEASAG